MNKILDTIWGKLSQPFVINENLIEPNSGLGATRAKSGARTINSVKSPKLTILALEPRLVFDGVAIVDPPIPQVDSAENVSTPAADSPDAGPIQAPVAATDISKPDASAPLFQVKQQDDTAVKATPIMSSASAATAPITDTVPQSVLIIDGRAPDMQAILNAAAPDVKVVILDTQKDGIQQIATALQGMHDIASISIVSHGDNGVLLLGNSPLFNGNLVKYSAELQAIGQALSIDGDILLYGCDVGAGAEGEAFLDALSTATGADIAASADDTGGIAKGGDWELEIATGSISYTNSFNEAQLTNYDHLLVTTSVSTRAALQTAINTGNTDNVDDVITITGNITFASSSDTIAINVTDGHTMSIVGGGFTLSGNNLTRVLNVTSSGAGSAVTIDNLIISNGFVTGAGGARTAGPGGAGGDALGANISNTGTLTITNSTITAGKAAGGGGAGGNVFNGTAAGAGGGGGGFGTTFGGASGNNFGGNVQAGPSAGTGGQGGGYVNGGQHLGGLGGTTTGGAGANYGGYSFAGNGGTANNGSIGIGGGGGGGGYNAAGGRGGNAVGGIYNTGTLTITGSSITNNIGAGGGGGGGSISGNAGGGVGNGGAGGSGTGAVWNAGGTVLMDSGTYSSMGTTNAGGGAAGGIASFSTSVNGAAGTATSKILTTSGTTNTNYTPDTTPPDLNSISFSDTALRAGETATVTFTFSEAVTGFTNADITVANGTLSAVSSSDGGTTWTATYTPTASIEDATNVISVNMAGVQDTAGNPGSGTTSSGNYTIDTLRPTATISVADTALAAGETSGVTIAFSEAVSGFTNADLTVANGTLSAVSSSDGGVTWTATLTPTASVQDATNVITLDNTGVADAAGNAGTGTTDSNNYAIDTLRPTASIVVADTALAIGETSTVTITFNEAVSGFTNADLTIANGTLGSVSSGDGGVTWTATLTPTASVQDATNVVTLDNTGVTDTAGNAGTGTTDSNNYAIDNLRPTASIVVADTALAIGETSTVTITFNEAVSGFTNADLTIANGTMGSVSSGDGGVTWTATLTPTASVQDATNVVTLDNTGVTDTAGNAGTGTTDSNNYAIDNLRPTASIVVADTALAIGETSTVTITFNEAVSGFTNADLTIANGTMGSVSSGDGGVTWTATLTPTASVQDATNVVTLDNTGVTDTAGNAGTGTTDSNNYAIDNLRPTASIVVADTALAIGETSTVTITFNEAVSGFTNADLTIANGTMGSVSSGDGGVTWTATLTPTASVQDATNVVTLDNTGVTDTAGNAGTGTTDSNNYAIDNLRPTASIVVADTALAIGETSAVTITFSEAVTGFTNADLTVANGALSAVSSSDGGITWTATLTPTAAITDATNVVTLDNTGVTDAAGNAGTGTTDSNNYAIDSLRPTATVVVADTALSAGETSTVTITFNEAVTGLTSADFTVANGALSGLSSSDGGITWTATLTPSTSINDATNVITLDNTGVADAAGNTGIGTTDSNNYAINTVRPIVGISLDDTALRAGETATVTFTFSEAVTGFTNADITVANGTLSSVSSSDGGVTWTGTFTPTADIEDSTNIITVDNTGYSNAATNTGTGSTDSSNYSIDTLLPIATVTIADTALSAGETSIVTITFNEAVTGLTTADFTVANGALSGLGTSDGGVTWTATLTPTAGTTDATNVITLDNTGLQDLSGNAGTGTTDSGNYAIDTLRPTASIVVADTALAIGETSTVTITFNEAVTGLTAADFTVANGVLSGLSSSDGGITWTASLTPTSGITDATNVITLDNTGVADAAGNTGIGTTDSNNYTINTQRPPVPRPSQDNIGALILLSNPRPPFFPVGTSEAFMLSESSKHEPIWAFDRPYYPSRLGLNLDTLQPDLQLEGAILNQVLTERQSFLFLIPRESFGHVANIPGIKFEATQVDGSPLPYWLHFDPRHLKFTGIPPHNAKGIEVMITVQDKNMDFGHIIFKISINKERIGNSGKISLNDNIDVNRKMSEPVDNGSEPVLAGKVGFTEQLSKTDKFSRLMESMALLDSLSYLVDHENNISN